jgi:hypothetical protein
LGVAAGENEAERKCYQEAGYQPETGALHYP